MMRRLSALDPGKQGLKLKGKYAGSDKTALSALDPGKQGLKHEREEEAGDDDEAFSA